jgi:mediator of RNA polymerase II transcription subunit 10
MSSNPHFPSPAPTPLPSNPLQPNQSTSNPSSGSQSQVYREVESKLLSLSQDLWEMEICAGNVGQGMEDAVPNYLYVCTFPQDTIC